MKSARIHPTARELSQVCRRLSEAGLSPGSTGEVSVRDGDLLWLTPRGMNLGDVQPEHLLLLWPNAHLNGQVIGNEDLLPPIDLPLHQALYEARADLGAIIRVRPPQACAWAINKMGQPQNGHPEEATLAGLQHPVLMMGSQGASAWMEQEGAQQPYDLIAMAELGILSMAGTLAEAFNAVEELEACATMNLQASGKAAQPVRISF